MSASFKQLLQNAIIDECEKLIRRHQTYAHEVENVLRRIERRSGIKPSKTIHVPGYWSLDRGFDPYYVRSNAHVIAHAINKALRKRSYSPRPAVKYQVPKKDGGEREVSVFQVADNALSKLVFNDLNSKNAARFSARSYAYRTDVSLHDSILFMSSEFSSDSRIYIAEFDFRKFFDSISHNFLENLLRSKRFLITQREMQIIRAFLSSPALNMENYIQQSDFKRTRGIPQGTSISLFLANAAGTLLDRKLEQLAVSFARYADDTVIWSTNYAELLQAVEQLEKTGEELGVELNLAKSKGVSILERTNEKSEFKSKSAFDFVGYSLSRQCISMADKNVESAKARIAYFIYSNLLETVKSETLVSERVAGNFDRDYLVMIMQIRRYLYGGMSEDQLRKYISAATPKIHFKGLMSFYPIVNDESQLKHLDGWMLHTIHTTLKKRSAYLQSQGLPRPQPHGLSRGDLIACESTTTGGTRVDLRLPSFTRISKLLQRAARIFGPNSIGNVQPPAYYS